MIVCNFNIVNGGQLRLTFSCIPFWQPFNLSLLIYVSLGDLVNELSPLFVGSGMVGHVCSLGSVVNRRRR